MSDIDRVREMLDEGRITKEEADQLIAVLRDVEAAEANLDAAGSPGVKPAGTPVEPPSAAPEAAPAAATPEASPTPAAAPTPPAQEPPVQEPPAQVPPAPPPPADGRTPPGSSDDGARQVNEAARAAAFTEAERDIARQAREAAREGGRIAREAAREARAAAREAARDAARVVRDAAREERESARQAAQDMRDSAAYTAREAARTATEAARAATGERPDVDDIGERPDKAIAPAGTPWVVIEMLGGDLDISVDPTIDVPVAEGGPGHVEVAEDPEGYKVRFMPERGNFLDRFLSSVRSGDLDVRIPPHFGVSIQATAGDVDLRGVRYLRGRLRAGDVSADRLEGVDFALMAGEFDATLDLRTGEHVVTVGAGDTTVRLAETADVSVTGRVSIGDLSARVDGLAQRAVGLGSEVSGVVGAGSARLRLRVTTGDLSLRAQRNDGRRG